MEKSSTALKTENDRVMDKLEGLWASKEADLEHCRLTTRYEVDKMNQAEICRLTDQMNDLEDRLRQQQNENIAKYVNLSGSVTPLF